MNTRPQVNVLGVGIDAIDLARAIATVEDWIRRGERYYVNVCTVHTVMECRRSPELRRIVNASGMATPDGMPLVWLSHLHGQGRSGRVYGPDLMLALCARSQETRHRHFFYGGGPDVAALLVERLRSRFPALQVAGVHTPPFRPSGELETSDVIDAINDARPDIIWVGLGAPKQDYWVARHRPLLNASAIIAVGAAFDFHAGLLPQAPRWMGRSGLEWSFRLAHEPRRLAFRYLVYNPIFVGASALQFLGLLRFPIER